MFKQAILAILLVCLVHKTLSCGGGGAKKPAATTVAPTKAPTEAPKKEEDPDLSDPAEETSDPEDDSSFDDPDADSNNEKGVDEPDELSCKGSDESCCWTNEQSNDDIDFLKGEGVKPEVAAFAAANGANIPDEYKNGDSAFLFAGAAPTGAEQVAWYKSCAVNCMDPTITVSVKAIAALGVKLEACLLDKDSSGPLSDCVEFAPPSADGSTSAEIEADGPQYDKHIVIVASGYMQGGVAAVDDVKVDFTKDECAAETTEGPTTEADTTVADTTVAETTVGEDTTPAEETTPSQESTTTGPVPPESETPSNANDLAACQAAGCGPSDEECTGYKSVGPLPGDKSPLPDNEWKTRGTETDDSEITNPATGVNDLKEPFLAAYLFPGESSVTASDEFELLEDRVLEFQRLERTNGAMVKLCYDEEASDCIYESSDEATVEDYSWTKETVTVTKGKKKLVWIFDNKGDNQGVAALRRIKFSKVAGGTEADPEAGESVCPPPSIPEKLRLARRRKITKRLQKAARLAKKAKLAKRAKLAKKARKAAKKARKN